MYYGIDSATATFPTGAATHDFYVGRLGVGKTADSIYFNSTGASLANYVYGYWGVQGPSKDPNYTTSYTTTNAKAWGKAQADAAYSAWQNNSKVNRCTIFADIEEGFGGWLTSSASLNYAVFQGFVDAIANRMYFYAGVYTSKGSWQKIMGTSNSPKYASTVWGANWPSGSTFNNPPSSMNGCVDINGIYPTIWQYYGEISSHDASVTGDANIASSLPL